MVLGFEVFEKLELPIQPLPQPVELVCELCGKTFQKEEWLYEPKLVPMCFKCTFHRKSVRLRGTGYSWTWGVEAEAGSAFRLATQQLSQLEAVIVALEEECQPHC